MNGLRVAHIDDNITWRGGERQVLELMKGLRERGVENLLVCRSGSEIGARAEEAGIATVNLPLLGEWDIISAFRMRALFARRGNHIVHAHTSHSHTLALLALIGNQSCRLIVSRRVDFHLHSFFSRKWKYGRSVHRIIAVSDAIRRILMEDGVDPGRIVTIRSGFIPDEFRSAASLTNLRQELGIPDDTVVIATVAALAPHKAHGVLLKAAHLVIKRCQRVRFLLAGEGEQRPEIERTIRNLGLESTVVLLGFVPDIGRVYRAADIFAISSSEEGLCSSILDALFFRLPVVATSAGGIPELVSDGVNGLLAPVNDHVSFAAHLCTLIDRPDLREQMGMRAVPVLERNSIGQTVAKTLEVYRETVQNGTRERFMNE
jgi:glycosyltransferase involved in cell wall biosynthesis